MLREFPVFQARVSEWAEAPTTRLAATPVVGATESKDGLAQETRAMATNEARSKRVGFMTMGWSVWIAGLKNAVGIEGVLHISHDR